MPEGTTSHPAAISPVAGSPAERFEELRRRHPRFIYERFTLGRAGQSLHAQFRFRLEPDIEFTPETFIKTLDWARVEEMPRAVLEDLFFPLGLIEMMSYWKAACSPEIVVRAGALTNEQITWWTELLRKGMGEYFYVNEIDFRAPDLVRVISAGTRDSEFANRDSGTAEKRMPSHESRDLVLTSGGKDSVVTLETLRAAGRPFDCLLLNPAQAALDIARQAGCDKPIIVRRTIDERLLHLNTAGYLNGHTPFSALLAFLGVAVAAMFGHRRVIVSNERSAEEATIEYLGEQINHQYSKTFEFETAFRDYCVKYLTPAEKQIPRSARNDNGEVEYFSLLRPLYELQIAERFSNYPPYFPLFRSCNRGQSTNSWCGCCPKCLFVWTALYPFVERNQMIAVFGKDLFEWEGASEVLRSLLGLDAARPFECVGTKEETLAAIHLCAEKYQQQNVALPPALAWIRDTVLASRSDLAALAQRVLSSWSDQHFVPEDLATSLRSV
jgi:hypothetical protein